MSRGNTKIAVCYCPWSLCVRVLHERFLYTACKSSKVIYTGCVRTELLHYLREIFRL